MSAHERATGWRVVHYDPLRRVLTLERARRFFQGRYRIVTQEAVFPFFQSGDVLRLVR